MGDVVKIFAKEPQYNQPKYIGSLCNDDYKLIRNRIIGHSKGGTKELINKLLIKAGWDPKRDERNIFIPVIETFMQISDINLSKLSDFVSNKEFYSFFQEKLQSKKVFNLYSMFYFGLRGIYPQEGIKKLVDQLWTITTCVNQVGVGPGEICLSLLTDAKKGHRGDLLMTKVGDVEVKSTQGRLGSGKNALLAADKIKNFFKKHKISDKKIFQRINKKLTWNWQQAVQVFFNYDWNFSNKEIIEMLTELATQSHSLEEKRLLYKGINNIFNKFKLKKILQKKNRLKLAELVIAIQLSSYQFEHKFKHLISVNKITKDAYSFYFLDKSLDKIVECVYNQIIKIGRFNSYMGIDNTGTRKGIDLILN